ncbi:MAG: hypothetical protein Q7R22_008495 [Verrucomicrobiota bacterium JB025]|nr:hypothetical protein [Verrucomicrobiota bacterium JB025]
MTTQKKLTRPRAWFRGLMALAAVTAACAGQGGRELPVGWLRFMPVGEHPPFRQEVRNGARYELEAPHGARPPRHVTVGSGGEEGTQFEEDATLILGRLSRFVSVVPGEARIVPKGAPAGDEGGPWHDLYVGAECRQWLAVMWRDERAGSWEKARHVLLPDDATSFAPGSIRFINTTPVRVSVRLGDQVIGLEPRSATVKRVGSGSVGLKVAVLDREGRWRKMYDGTVSQGTGDRTNVVVSVADGERPRKPVMVTTVRDRVPAPPVALTKK